MKIKKLLEELSFISFKGNLEQEVTGITHNSKEVKQGFIFIAIKGMNFDGNNFIEEAINRGAGCIVSEMPPKANMTWVQVNDSRSALSRMSKIFFENPSEKLNLIGVTGTNGKTSVTFMMKDILEEAGLLPGIIGTLSYQWLDKEIVADRTTPEADQITKILNEMVSDGITHCAMEVSSHSLELKRVEDLNFKIAIFTNLTGDHLDYHGTMENYYRAKKKLFSLLDEKNGWAIINVDDQYGKRLITELNSCYLLYSVNEKSDVYPVKYNLGKDGIKSLVYTPLGEFEIESSLLGKPNLYNLLACIGACLSLKIPLEKISYGIRKIGDIKGRLELVPNDLGLNVFVDYAHSDDSLRNILETVRELKPKRIILVFGAGGDRDRLKRPRMGEVAAKSADFTIITSDNPRSENPIDIIKDIEVGFNKIKSTDYTILPDREEAIFKAIEMAEDGDAVIIAGKGHENYQVFKDKILPFSDREVAERALKVKRENV
ncbi:MAG: UDP-N-acetylmuramoyl-L-alanyl-D-glutamate--2,6-diaminopimelate ligase [Acidobacteriota bacterium]